MAERVALNLRLPKSLHRGLVALAEREYRSLNDQIVAILARTVIDQFDPRRDDLAAIVKPFVLASEPFMVLWNRYYPEKVVRATPITFEVGQETVVDGLTVEQRLAHQRLEAASAELIRAFYAWEQSLGEPNTNTVIND